MNQDSHNPEAPRPFPKAYPGSPTHEISYGGCLDGISEDQIAQLIEHFPNTMAYMWSAYSNGGFWDDLAEELFQDNDAIEASGGVQYRPESVVMMVIDPAMSIWESKPGYKWPSDIEPRYYGVKEHLTAAQVRLKNETGNHYFWGKAAEDYYSVVKIEEPHELGSKINPYGDYDSYKAAEEDRLSWTPENSDEITDPNWPDKFMTVLVTSDDRRIG
jgi:hypothetical protein